jgi:hypothetical protein
MGKAAGEGNESIDGLLYKNRKCLKNKSGDPYGGQILLQAVY